MALSLCIGLAAACHGGSLVDTFDRSPVQGCAGDDDCSMDEAAGSYDALDAQAEQTPGDARWPVTSERDTSVLDALPPSPTADGSVFVDPWWWDASYSDASGDAAVDGALADAEMPATPELRYVAPRVLYVGEAQSVRLFGRDLRPQESTMLYLDGTSLGAFTSLNDHEGSVELPALAPGEHFLQVAAPGDAQRPGARLVVTEHAHYENVDLPIAGSASSVIYDPERRALFALLQPPSGRGRLLRAQFGAAGWSLSELELPAPLGFTLTADGREILVTNSGCILLHVDPSEMKLTRTENLPTSCFYEVYGLIHAFADGRVLYGNTNQHSMVWEYPSFAVAMAPSTYSPVSALSPYQTRLLYGDSSGISAGRTLYRYDAGSRMFENLRTLGGDFYSSQLLALSGDGERMLHNGDVYDGSLRFLGSLQNVTTSPMSVALSANGKVAASYDPQSSNLTAYDVSASSPPFAALGAALPIAGDSVGWITRLMLDERGETAFGFTLRVINSNNNEYSSHFIARRLRP